MFLNQSEPRVGFGHRFDIVPVVAKVTDWMFWYHHNHPIVELTYRLVKSRN